MFVSTGKPSKMLSILSLTGSEWLTGQMESCSPFWRGLDAFEPVEEDEA